MGEAALRLASAADAEIRGVHTMTMAALADIHVKEGHNPRKFFADTEFRELCNSVRAMGVLQNLTVRPREEGGYWLVAGERRFRAAKEVGLHAVPVTIASIGEEEAFQVATAENTLRSDMSFVEEAHAARKIVEASEGDKAEALRRLGWTDQKLEGRLLILHCTSAVQEALTERRIKLGHAELLAGLPEKTQDGTLPKIIENGISVADLKTRIAGIARELTAAIFDKAACTSCSHNSSTARALFSEFIDEGRCQDRECYSKKTTETLEAKRKELHGVYSVVYFDTERQPDTYRTVFTGGADGVGPEQFTACKGCGKFGALLDTTPGREGKLRDDLCFDTDCLAEKAKAFAAESAKNTTASATDAQKPGGRQEKDKNGKKAAAAVTPKRVEEKIDAYYRALSGEVVKSSFEMQRAIMLFALLTEADFPQTILEAHGFRATGNKALSRNNRAESLTALYGVSNHTARAMACDLTSHIASVKTTQFADNSMVKASQSIVAVTGTDLAGRFKIDEDFLKAHTKGGVEALMAEAGFGPWYDAKNGDGSYKKLLAGKAADLVKGIMESGFDFSTFVPASVSRRVVSAKG